MTSDPGYDQAKDSANRLAPRPISRPPVDPVSRREFGRPAGLRGSFVAERVRPKKYREQSEFRPSEQPADPVLQEAFSRPDGSPETLQRHPVDSGALAAEKDGVEPDHADDPWRDPGAPAALGTPAVAPSPSRSALGYGGKLGVRDVLFGGKVSYLALLVLLLIALVIGLIGGVVGRKTAEVAEAFTTSKVTLSTNGNGEAPAGRFAKVAA
ncbi:serine protease, partial [Mycobacterium avium subsp. hominissuis]